MIYIESILLCLALPPALSLLFTRERSRNYTVFVILGMLTCLFSAYASSFFMEYYGVDTVITAIEITPVCEECMKLLPLLFYFLIFEPDPKVLPSASIAIAVGFATLENACYLVENDTIVFHLLLIRGISAGALHILCGIFSGFGIACICRHRWLTLTGTVGILGACAGFHGIYNLLVSAEGSFQMLGYLFPSVLILSLFMLKNLLSRLTFHFS